TREGHLRRLIAEGLWKRYGIRARAEGKEFIVESVADPSRLPTYQPSVVSGPSSVADSEAEGAEAKESGQRATAEPSAQIAIRKSQIANPLVTAAVKALLDRLQQELAVIEKT